MTRVGLTPIVVPQLLRVILLPRTAVMPLLCALQLRQKKYQENFRSASVVVAFMPLQILKAEHGVFQKRFVFHGLGGLFCSLAVLCFSPTTGHLELVRCLALLSSYSRPNDRNVRTRSRPCAVLHVSVTNWRVLLGPIEKDSAENFRSKTNDEYTRDACDEF